MCLSRPLSIDSIPWCPPIRTSTVSRTLITPGWRRVRSFLTAFLASGSRALFAVTSKENILQFEPSSYQMLGLEQKVHCVLLTRFVPLFNTHILVSISTRSPKVYGNGGPFEIADATADLKNSMSH